MTNIKVIARTSKVKENGEIPLYLRVTKHRVAKFISLKISVKQDCWDLKNQEVKSKHPNSARINATIRKKKAEAEDLVLETELTNRNISGSLLMQKIKGDNNPSLLKYLEKHMAEQKILENIGTYQKAKAVYQKLKVYWGKKDLYFSDVNYSFLKNYDFYLRTCLKNSINTVSSNFRLIRKLFNDAIKEELIKREIYPFDKYKITQVKSFKDQLDEEDVNKLIGLNLPKGSRLDDHRNLFIFCCYTGFRISDLLQLQWKHWDGRNITIVMHKTKESISIRVPLRGVEILRIYGLENCKSHPNNYIFPFLENGMQYTKKGIFNAISSNTAYINKDLKKIAISAELTKQNLSCHWGRRTFTCVALSRGMSLDHVSKLLGHQNIKVTLSSYAKFLQEDLNKAMDVFEDAPTK